MITKNDVDRAHEEYQATRRRLGENADETMRKWMHWFQLREEYGKQRAKLQHQQQGNPLFSFHPALLPKHVRDERPITRGWWRNASLQERERALRLHGFKGRQAAFLAESPYSEVFGDRNPMKRRRKNVEFGEYERGVFHPWTRQPKSRRKQAKRKRANPVVPVPGGGFRSTHEGRMGPIRKSRRDAEMDLMNLKNPRSARRKANVRRKKKTKHAMPAGLARYWREQRRTKNARKKRKAKTWHRAMARVGSAKSASAWMKAMGSFPGRNLRRRSARRVVNPKRPIDLGFSPTKKQKKGIARVIRRYTGKRVQWV